MAVETRKKIFDRAVADKLAISGTHWLMPNVGRLAKDGNTYVFSPEPGASTLLPILGDRPRQLLAAALRLLVDPMPGTDGSCRHRLTVSGARMPDRP
jgi:hypothetical protein